MFKDVADVQTADMLDLPVPKANFETVLSEPSDMQKQMVQDLSERATKIHDADSESKKKELFAKVRKGRVRILFGSTQKMGAGTNVQEKLIKTLRRRSYF